MCRKVSCSSCHKATWAGCGRHILDALKDVQEEDRCKGWKTGKCPESKSTNEDNTSGCTI